MGAQAETHDRKTVLRHGGALPREAESRRERKKTASLLPFPLHGVCITKTEKAESEAQRSKPKGALGSESRNARL